MGAAPPRQTEFRFRLVGSDFTNQLRIVLDAFFAFGFPAIPEDALAAIRSAEGTGPIHVSVVTSSEGFVRLGVMLPNPAPAVISAFCTLAGTRADDILRFQAALEARAPSFVEYQYLMKGFGYAVYKEGQLLFFFLFLFAFSLLFFSSFDFDFVFVFVFVFVLFCFVLFCYHLFSSLFLF